jgi:hypothetical protein
MHVLRFASVMLVASATLFGCYDPAATGEAAQSLTAAGDLRANPASAFIARYGDEEGRLCRRDARGASCVSADRRQPVTASNVPAGGLFYDCARSADGRLTSCAPPPVPYHCMQHLCECYSMADCIDLAVEQQCDVAIFDDHLGGISGECMRD